MDVILIAPNCHSTAAHGIVGLGLPSAVTIATTVYAATVAADVASPDVVWPDTWAIETIARLEGPVPSHQWPFAISAPIGRILSCGRGGECGDECERGDRSENEHAHGILLVALPQTSVED
jgi:hypothetical protein